MSDIEINYESEEENKQNINHSDNNIVPNNIMQLQVGLVSKCFISTNKDSPFDLITKLLSVETPSINDTNENLKETTSSPKPPQNLWRILKVIIVERF